MISSCLSVSGLVAPTRQRKENCVGRVARLRLAYEQTVTDQTAHGLRRVGHGLGGQRADSVSCSTSNNVKAVGRLANVLTVECVKEVECSLKCDYGVKKTSRCVSWLVKAVVCVMNWPTNARGFADPTIASRFCARRS